MNSGTRTIDGEPVLNLVMILSLTDNTNSTSIFPPHLTGPPDPLAFQIQTGDCPLTQYGCPLNYYAASLTQLVQVDPAGDFAFTGTVSDFEVLLVGVPGPIAGAGLPGLILACGGLLALARRRRQRAPTNLRPDLRERWPSRLVATAAENRLNIRPNPRTRRVLR
jgi:hypothetical protein